MLARNVRTRDDPALQSDRSEPSQGLWSGASARRICALAIVVNAGTFVPRASAQDLTLKAPRQSQPILIAGATVHPVSGPTIADGYVLFTNGKIDSVGRGSPAPSVTGVANAKRIDATGKHVYPGLIGAYTQIGLSEIQSVRASEDQREVGQITPEAQTLVSINPDSTLIPVTRATGVLSVGVFPTGGLVIGQPCVISLEGWTWEEMAVRRSLGVVVNWPFPRPTTARWMRQSSDDQLKRITRSLTTIDETFRTARAYAQARENGPGTTPDIRWEAMRPLFAPSLPPSSSPSPSSSANKPGGTGVPPVSSAPPLPSSSSQVFILANDSEQIEQAVVWAIDLGLRPVIVGGRDAPLCADLLRRHRVPVIVQGVHNFPKRADSDYDAAFTLPATLESLGITWCLASGEETAHERSLPHHAGRTVGNGLSLDAAIRSVTLSAAEVLGVADSLGSLEPGKAATIIITDGNPLEITTHVTQAFINGRDIDLSTKQSKLAEKYREKYRQQREQK